jgi:hypothetical protein
MELLASKYPIVGAIGYNYGYQQKEGQRMNLEQFRAHIEATRQASKAEALSVLSATITTTKKKEETNVR